MNSQPQTIFEKIISGEIASYPVYEDELTFAFLDIHPIQPGQILVIPKVAVPHIWDLDDTTYSALLAAAKKLALRLRSEYPKESHVAMIVEGLEVAHAHIKLFPFSTHEQFTNKPSQDEQVDHSALAEIANRLRIA